MVFGGNSCYCPSRGLAKSGEFDRERFAEFEDWVGAIEKRLSDIQEVVLSIDEKLEKGGRL